MSKIDLAVFQRVRADLEHAIASFRRVVPAETEPAELAVLIDAIGKVLQWQEVGHISLARQMSINSQLFTQVMNSQPIPVADAERVATKLVAIMDKTIGRGGNDGIFVVGPYTTSPNPDSIVPSSNRNDQQHPLDESGNQSDTQFDSPIVTRSEANIVRPLQWVKSPRTPEVKSYIEELEILLPKVIRYTRFSNLGPDESAITDDERAHLIDVLETALMLLKAPLIEVGIIEAARSGLAAASYKLTEKGVEYATFGIIMGLFEQLGHALTQL